MILMRMMDGEDMNSVEEEEEEAIFAIAALSPVDCNPMTTDLSCARAERAIAIATGTFNEMFILRKKL